LAKQGFNVILVSRSAEKLAKVKETLEKTYTLVKFMTVLSNANECTQSNIASLINAVQQKDISLLVNNVGIDGDGAHLFETMRFEELTAMLNVNCLYPTLLTAALIPILSKRNGQRSAIINVSSVGCVLPMPYLTVYVATKAYNRTFSLALSKELSPLGISVLAVLPGYVATNMSKVSTSHLLACSTRACALGSLRHLGLVNECEPYYMHSLTRWIGAAIIPMIPGSAATSLSKTMLKQVIKKAE
jgi:17beta-estradiol 17-dehydrogenase / very-long-chain 3-oxoacyl-CoA reductase